MTNSRILILITACFLLTSCFRVKETVILSKDGSGIFEFIVDMSESKYFLRMAKNLAELAEGKSPDEQINRNLSRTLGYLEKTPGISATQLIKNDSDFIYELTFNFEDVASLNRAIAQFFHEEDRRTEEFYQLKKRTFRRNGAISLYELVEKETKNEKSRIKGLDPGDVFSTVTYSTHYIFDRKIRRYSNPDAELSEDEKEIQLDYLVFEDREGLGIENEIKFRR
jgi:hypothetical protein